MMIGFTLALTAIRGNAANDSSLAFLFAGDAAGFLADGFAPPPFDPAHLFGTNTPGFYAGGYEASP